MIIIIIISKTSHNKCISKFNQIDGSYISLNMDSLKNYLRMLFTLRARVLDLRGTYEPKGLKI